MNLRRSMPRAATVALTLALGLPAVAYAELVTPRISPKATVTQTIGITDLSLTYSRPGVKDRAIWGGLVPYDEPWRTGANEATKFTTTHDITVGGQALPAGSYSLVTIPTSGDWTVVFSKQSDLLGTSNYDPAHDVMRLTVTPKAADHVEWMRFTFDNLTPASADLTLRWEKLAVAVPIAVDVAGIWLPMARAELAQAKADDWRVPYRAASWAYENDVALAEAAQWLDTSIAAQANYTNLSLKARWQAKNGDTKSAIATAKKALAEAKKAENPPDTKPLETLVAEWSGKKK